VKLDSTTGLLPAGIHPATVQDVEDTFVTPFQGSTTRAGIFSFWVEHRKAIADFVVLGKQWLDGSFVTDKNDPGDADVVTFLDPDEVDQLPPHRVIMLQGLMGGPYTRGLWRCDSYYIAEYPLGHPYRQTYEQYVQYWNGHFSKVRGSPSTVKGFVEVSP
jgi:hypothetical protein